MVAFNEVADTPIEIVIAGKKLSARRPDLNAIFGEMEARIVSKSIATINQAVKEFGLEGDDKVKFLYESMQTIPKGVELQKQAQESLASAEGTSMLLHNVLRDDPSVTDKEVMQLVMADPTGAAEWMAYLTGDRKKRPVSKEVRTNP